MEQVSKNLKKYIISIFSIVVFLLFVFAAINYKGQLYIYLFFSLLSNFCLLFAFRKNALFFDTFINCLLWLGFWLKLTIRLIFFDGLYNEPVGNFDHSGAAYDEVLIVICIGLIGFLCASLLREKWLFNYPAKIPFNQASGLYRFYSRYRNRILISFILIILLISISNIFLGIYQRGLIPTVVPAFGIDGLYKWLLLFGFASISSIIIMNELVKFNRLTSVAIIIGIFETFFSNVSLLSRGMIINAGALCYGIYKSHLSGKFTTGIRIVTIGISLLIIFFICSVYISNYLRIKNLNESIYSLLPNNVNQNYGIFEIKDREYKKNEINKIKHNKKSKKKFSEYLKSNTNIFMKLFIDRWVGMETMMAVSSYPDKGWSLWTDAWAEKFQYNQMTFYDRQFVSSQYVKTDFIKHHNISVPGILAFFYYPGSKLFLLFTMFCLGLFAAGIEIIVFRFCNANMVLCSLFSMVIAYRFAHFGYAPAQSYLLFGALTFNIFLIYLLDILLSRYMWNKNEELRSG